jgi:hypothetical protein
MGVKYSLIVGLVVPGAVGVLGLFSRAALISSSLNKVSSSLTAITESRSIPSSTAASWSASLGKRGLTVLLISELSF